MTEKQSPLSRSTSVLSPTSPTTKTEHRYGWFGFTPQCLQIFNNAKFFLVIICLLQVWFIGATSGLSGVTQSSIETRFQLSSTSSAWIISAYDIGSLPSLLVIAYIGSKGVHRPRWVSIGMVLAYAGIFLFALPHFTTPVYKPVEGGGDAEEWLCENRTDVCNDDENPEGSLSNYLVIFVLSRVIMGVFGVVMSMVGMTYLDDCLPPGKFTLYSALYAMGGIIGAAIGFLFGGLMLSLYTDWTTINPEDIGLSPDDPLWVGAWWLGYVLIAILGVLTVIPMSGFPIDLPGAADIRAHKETEAFKGKEDEDKPLDVNKIDFGLKDVPRYCKVIFTNWSFLCVCVLVICDMMIVSGFTAFGPKYVEEQFNKSAAQAGIIFGAVAVPSGVIGSLLAGIIVEKLNLRVSQMMLLQTVESFIVLLCIFAMFATCEQAPFAGVNTDYGNLSSIKTASLAYNDLYSEELTAPCNEECFCENVPFQPVCSTENVQYFSPCHAGCTHVDDSQKLYQNCTCINATSETDYEAERTVCGTPDCIMLPIFCVFLFIAMIGLFMSESMTISLVIRLVPNTHRLFAMMTQSILLRVVGSIPGPIIFGVAFDSACLLWQNNCGKQGSCFYYDNEELSRILFIIIFTIKAISVVSMFIAWKLYVPPQTMKILETEINPPTVVNNMQSESTLSNGVHSDMVSKKESKSIDTQSRDVDKRLSDADVEDFFSSSDDENLPKYLQDTISNKDKYEVYDNYGLDEIGSESTDF